MTSPAGDGLMQRRQQDPAEELANALTHGAGLVLSFAGLIAMLIYAGLRGTGWHMAGCAVFGASLVILYGASTLYHAVRRPGLKKALRLADHLCIYLLIAGTYTPFTLTLLRGGTGWTLFGLIWSLAAAGVIFKLVFRHRYEGFSLALYLAMGWLALAAIRPMMDAIPPGGLAWLAAGGLCYTAGTIFYARDRNRFFHAIWHGFVMGGSACHFVAVMGYVVP